MQLNGFQAHTHRVFHQSSYQTVLLEKACPLFSLAGFPLDWSLPQKGAVSASVVDSMFPVDPKAHFAFASETMFHCIVFGLQLR